MPIVEVAPGKTVNVKPGDTLFPLRDAADYRKVHRSRVYQWVKAGRLPVYGDKPHQKVLKSELDALEPLPPGRPRKHKEA